MSRSRKKHPCATDKNNKFQKKMHNRKVRRTDDVPGKSGHKKMTESWSISDYSFLPGEDINNKTWNEKKDYISK